MFSIGPALVLLAVFFGAATNVRGQAFVSSNSISGLRFWDRGNTGTTFLLDPASSKLALLANGAGVLTVETDGRIGVAPKTVERMKAKVRELWEARQSLTSEQLREQWQRYIRGWWNYFQLANWRREVEDLTGWTRRHMRKCFWLRWHHPRGRLNALKRLGVRGRALGNAYCAKGAWAMALHPTLQQALKNATLQRYGFIIPWILTPAPK